MALIKKNSTLMIVLLILVIVFVGFLYLVYIKPLEQYGNQPSGPSSTSVSRTQVLREELSYLSDFPEVAWVEIESNTAYIGFSSLPTDWEMIIKGAALRGNKAINFGCHVWAVDANKKGWRPGDGPYYGEFTARYGKLE